MAEASQVSVISPRFCVPDSVDLAISESFWRLIGLGDFVVKDSNGSLVFRVERPFSFRNRKVIHDSAGVPVVTLQSEIFSGRNAWRVFRGESTEEKELLFRARRSSRFQMKTKLHVFVADNTSEDVCDYTAVEGGWFYRSCEVYAGDSSTIVAKMQENSAFTGKDKFTVTVYPNIDYGFIVALIIVFVEITSQKRRSLHRSKAVGGNSTHQTSSLHPT